MLKDKELIFNILCNEWVFELEFKRPHNRIDKKLFVHSDELFNDTARTVYQGPLYQGQYFIASAVAGYRWPEDDDEIIGKEYFYACFLGCEYYDVKGNLCKKKVLDTTTPILENSEVRVYAIIMWDARPDIAGTLMIDYRRNRKKKNWQRSDRLRNIIKEMNYIVEDKTDGSSIFFENTVDYRWKLMCRQQTAEGKRIYRKEQELKESKGIEKK